MSRKWTNADKKKYRYNRRSENYLRFSAREAQLHPDRVAFTPTVKRSQSLKFLTVSNEFWMATAIWKKVSGAWCCASADPRLKWTIGQSPDKVHLELLRLGADFTWGQTPLRIGVEIPPASDISGSTPSPLGKAIPPHRTGLPNTSQGSGPESSWRVGTSPI